MGVKRKRRPSPWSDPLGGEPIDRRRRPSKGKTATRWRTGEAMAFVVLVDAIRYANCYSRRPLAWKYAWRHLQAMRYGVHNDEAKLKADYWSAVNHFLDQHEQRLPHMPDAYALIDMVEDHFKLSADGWEIDWSRALKEIHNHDHWITVRRLKARYESALQRIEEAHAKGSQNLQQQSRSWLHASYNVG
jgi:hypothetical protein